MHTDTFRRTGSVPSEQLPSVHGGPSAGHFSLHMLACSDTPRGGRSGNRFPVGARFSVPVQTDSGAYPASCTMGTESLYWGQTCRNVALTNYPHLTPRLKKEQSYTSTPPLGLHSLSQNEFYLCVFHVRPVKFHSQFLTITAPYST